jgi:hypothetical protein
MILEKWQCNVTTSIESWSLWKRSLVTKAYRSRNHFCTLFIAFLGYAIEGGLRLN